MTFVIGPSRNKTLQLAWAMLRAGDRAEKKEKPEVAKAGASKPKSSLSRRTASKNVAAKKKPVAKKAAKKGKK